MTRTAWTVPSSWSPRTRADRAEVECWVSACFDEFLPNEWDWITIVSRANWANFCTCCERISQWFGGVSRFKKDWLTIDGDLRWPGWWYIPLHFEPPAAIPSLGCTGMFVSRPPPGGTSLWREHARPGPVLPESGGYWLTLEIREFLPCRNTISSQ